MDQYKKFLACNMDLLYFIIIVTLKALLFTNAVSPSRINFVDKFLPIAASVLVVAGISCILGKKARAKFLYTFNLVISCFIVADLCYFRYFKDLISIPVMLNGFQLGAVESSVGNLLNLRDFGFLLDLLLVVPVIDRMKYKKSSDVSLKTRLASFLILAALGGMVDGFEMYQLSVEQPRLLTTMYNRTYVATSLGAVNYHLLDAFSASKVAITKNIPVSNKTEQEIKSYLNSKDEAPSTRKLHGEYEGKNLLMIQVEALQQFVIGASVNGQEVTPNLNKWIGKSMYFDNYFYQVASGGTSDAEFMTNNSLYPAASGAAYFMYSGNTFNSLPQALKAKGYDTAAMHGYKETFWNRNVMYKNFQFNSFQSEKSYDLNEEIGLGLSDKEFLSQSIDKIKDLQEPYFNFMITLSSHYPYDDVSKYGDFDTGSYEGSLMGNYLKAIHYADAELGMFLDDLQKEGMLDDTVVAVYGDHYAIPKSDESQLYSFLGMESPNEYSWASLQKVPAFIHFPQDANKGVVSTYGGEMDMYPTLCNLFNLPEKNLMGKDLINSTDGNVVFRDGSFTDGNYFFISTSGNYYDVKSGEKVQETDYLKNMREKALSSLEYSDDMLKHDLLKKFDK